MTDDDDDDDGDGWWRTVMTMTDDGRRTTDDARFPHPAPKRGLNTAKYRVYRCAGRCTPLVHPPCIPLCTPRRTHPVRAWRTTEVRASSRKSPYRQQEILDSCNNVPRPKMTVKSDANLKCTAFGHVASQTGNQL